MKTDRNSRIRELIEFVRTMPSGDSMVRDLESLLAEAILLADSITTALARDDIPEGARRGLWNAIYAVDQTVKQDAAQEKGCEVDK